MGSEMELLAWGVEGQRYLSWAIDEAERLEQCWSRFRPTSELSALNSSKGQPHSCSTLLWAAVERAATAWHETGGLFDATVLDTLVTLGYSDTFRAVAPSGPAVRAVPVPVFGQITLDAASSTVVVPGGIALDLGGLGKGLTADMLVAGLLERGATSVMISAGGDIRVGGPGPDDDDAWMTEIEHPIDASTLLRFPLVDEALVQSTTRLRRWERGGVQLHHLIDPRTGWPAETGLAAVVVTGPQAWRAEVMAKAALIAGEREGLALLARVGHDGWLVRDDATVVATADVAGDLPSAQEGAHAG